MSFLDWISGKNNPSIPKSEYLYGTRHIIVLLTVLALVVVLSIILKNKSDKTKNIFFKVCVSIFLAFEILSRVFNLIFTDDYSLEHIVKIILPLHFCSVMVWIIIIALLTNNKPFINYAVIGGLLATTAYLLFPAVGLNKTFLSFDALYSICSHSLGWVVCILLITTGYAKFDFKKIWQPYAITVAIIGYAALFNFVIFPGSDYMYMRENPLSFNSAIPYQIIFLAVIAIYILMFYLISFGVKKCKKTNKKSNP
ncbi:MAG: YwaF family protein [Clostridia bacterium]